MIQKGIEKQQIPGFKKFKFINKILKTEVKSLKILKQKASLNVNLYCNYNDRGLN